MNIADKLNLIMDNLSKIYSAGYEKGIIDGESNNLDTSDATATAEEIFAGETAYANNEKVTGTFTINNEITAQDDLILQIQTALAGKSAVGSGVGLVFKNCSVTDDGNGNVTITNEGV